MDGCFCPPGQGCSHTILVPSLITFKDVFFQTPMFVNVYADTGTVFDDISLRGCIAQSECQCKHNKIYNSGEVYRQDRKEWYVKTVFFVIILYLFIQHANCGISFVNLKYLVPSSTCSEGKWACKTLQIPATCAVEEGSHVTTFDGKTFTFHGDCYYTLAKVESKVME